MFLIIFNNQFTKIYQTFILHKKWYAQDTMYLYACLCLYLVYGIIGFKDHKWSFIPTIIKLQVCIYNDCRF